VQADTTNERESPDLVSLGTLFYEPLWLFCRCTTLRALLHDRPNGKASIGPVGSATRPLALKLLELNGLDTSKMQLSGDVPEDAARRLIAGEIDAAPMLTAWESPAVHQLLRAPDITLIQFPRADAYVALNPKFNKLLLPAGVGDLASNRPPEDVTLIASKASLVVRRDLHPALQYLLLRAAIEVHSPPGIFEHAGEFPAPEVIDLPISDEARSIYKSGPSFLQRTLPFWLVELVQRLLIIFLPIVGILYPLWSLLLKTYRWQMQRRIFRLYGELRVIEQKLRESSDPEERAQLIARIQVLERRAVSMKVPRFLSEMSFNLKAHAHALSESPKKDA
jgi:NMT1-like family